MNSVRAGRLGRKYRWVLPTWWVLAFILVSINLHVLLKEPEWSATLFFTIAETLLLFILSIYGLYVHNQKSQLQTANYVRLESQGGGAEEDDTTPEISYSKVLYICKRVRFN